MDMDALRERIDRIDEKIIDLINKRAKVAVKIGKLKRSGRQHIFSPRREKEVLKRICKLNNGPMSDRTLKAVYREIMSGSLALEKEIRIAYLGPEATFTHQAALSKFGSSVSYLTVPTIADVFATVEAEKADYGVVPIENSTEGAVNHTLDMFMDSDVKVFSEIYLDISHCLMSRVRFDDIAKIYSKAEVFAQCRQWLRLNLPSVEHVETSSTTKASEITRREAGAACIASELAASIYKLKILRRSIQDIPHNVTQFLDRIGHPLLAEVTVKINEEVIFPRPFP